MEIGNLDEYYTDFTTKGGIREPLAYIHEVTEEEAAALNEAAKINGQPATHKKVAPVYWSTRRAIIVALCTHDQARKNLVRESENTPRKPEDEACATSLTMRIHGAENSMQVTPEEVVLLKQMAKEVPLPRLVLAQFFKELETAGAMANGQHNASETPEE